MRNIAYGQTSLWREVSGIGIFGSRQDIQECRLSAPVQADQTDPVSGKNAEGQIFEEGSAAVGFGKGLAAKKETHPLRLCKSRIFSPFKTLELLPNRTSWGILPAHLLLDMTARGLRGLPLDTPLGRKECIFPQEEELRMAAPGRVRIFADSSWARDLHGVPLGMFWDREEGSF